jgi:hypothetical protein
MNNRLLLFFSIVFLVACGSKNNDKNALVEKKAALEKLVQLKAKTEAEIKSLQDEINRLGGSETDAATLTLVAVQPVSASAFTHYIDLRGRVDAEDISYVTPRGMGGEKRTVAAETRRCHHAAVVSGSKKTIRSIAHAGYVH